MSLDDIKLSFPASTELEADWVLPRPYNQEVAQQFCRDLVIRYLEEFPELQTKIDREATTEESRWSYEDVVSALLEAAGESDDDLAEHFAEVMERMSTRKQTTLAAAIVYTFGPEALERLDSDPELLARFDKILEDSRRPDLGQLAAKWHERREGTNPLEIDYAVALRLLQMEFDGNFHAYRRWYLGTPNQVVSPEETVAGMGDAAKTLSAALDSGDEIAVFCDYDVDGTTAGEVFRRSVEPYGAKLHYGYADAQSGFGLTEDFVRDAAKRGCKVLVTLDCGSGQADKVELAQKLGMKVIVVDHHVADENPADHHLNPKLAEPASSENTGAQLSWKLGAALQSEREGQTRPEHWEETMHLAGMGCLADMGSVVLPENRAFFWHPHESPPAGFKALAERMEEDPTDPSATVTTRAVMNLPKRTPRVSAGDVGKLLAAKTETEAKPIIDKLLGEYEKAKPMRQEMNKAAVAQVGEAVWNDDGTVTRPERDKYFAAAVLGPEFSDYAGYSGTVASKASKAAAKPAIVFAYKGTDEHGQKLYKFSMRNDSGVKLNVGGLIEHEPMREACKLKVSDENGNVTEAPVVGGHHDVGASVCSGTCTEDNIEKIQALIEEWATSEEKIARKRGGIWPGPRKQSIFVEERKLDPKRLDAVERQAARLGPFTFNQQRLLPPRKGRPDRLARNPELKVTMVGRLELNGELDPDNENFKVGKLRLGDGVEREVRYPADDEKPPTDRDVEWILTVRGPNQPYWLRKYEDLRASSDNGSGS